MVRLVRCLFAAGALIILGVGPLHAQSASTASIGGTVRDASGGVLPGVTVTARISSPGFLLVRIASSSPCQGSAPTRRRASCCR